MHPPKHLSRAMRAWWRLVVRECELDSHHYKILELACGAWDRSEQARMALEAADALTYTDRFGSPKPRPEVAIERDARLSFARLVRELGLDAAGIEAPRPVPLPANMRGKRHAG